jgi:hypothetical protein
MRRWHWGVLSILVALALYDVCLVGRGYKTKPIPPVPATAGLSVSDERGELRLDWNRKAPAILGADHAVLEIRDGNHQSRLELNKGQIAGAGVRYRPESGLVQFRLELYAPDGARTVESADATVSKPVKAGAKAVVERNRPSPFERTRPAMAKRREPQDVRAEVRTVREQEKPESGWGRFVSRIPLVRRLKKHPQVNEVTPVADTGAR